MFKILNFLAFISRVLCKIPNTDYLPFFNFSLKLFFVRTEDQDIKYSVCVTAYILLTRFHCSGEIKNTPLLSTIAERKGYLVLVLVIRVHNKIPIQSLFKALFGLQLNSVYINNLQILHDRCSQHIFSCPYRTSVFLPYTAEILLFSQNLE